jgi:hypothetical protein
LQLPLTQRSPGPHPSSPQQFGLPDGQQVRVSLVRPATVPSGQQKVGVSLRFCVQQTRLIVDREDGDEPP